MISPNRTSGPLIPGTATDTSGGLAYWSTPNNAKVEDAAVAFDGNVGPGGGGHGGFALELTNYSFAIPSNAVIDGIKLEAKVSGFSGMHDDQIYLKWASGTIGGFTNAPNYGQFWGTSLNWLTWGGPTTLWGRTWTPAEINNSAFGAGLAGFPNSGTAQANIDAVKITVYWHFDTTVAPAEVAQRYDYKIYDPGGKFLGNLPNVVKPFSTSQAINTVGAPLTIEAGGTPDGQMPSVAPGALLRWYGANWKYRIKITVPKTNVTGDVANLPVYVPLPNLGSQFWSAVDSTAKDIRFTDQYGVQELPFEIQSFNKSTKAGNIWVKVPLINGSYDTDFYIYYGNNAASLYAATDTYGSRNVWSDFAVALHLDDGTTLNLADSSPSNLTITNTGGVAASAAKLNGGAISNASGSWLQTPTAISIASSFEVSTWFNWPLPSTGAGNYNTLVRGTTSPVGDHPVIKFNDTGMLGMFDNVGGGGFRSSGYNMNFLSNGLHRLLAVGSGSTTAFYIDGVLVGTSDRKSNSNIQYIGNYQGGGQQWGVMDEFRIATGVARTAAYAAAEYSNMNNPSAFTTFGKQQLQTVEDTSGVLLRNGNLVAVFETSYYYPNGKVKFQGQIKRVEAEFAPEVNGIVRALCISDGRDLDNMVARGVPFTYTNDVSQTSQNASISNFTNGGKGVSWDRFGQSWTPGATTLGRISLLLAGTANVTINVYASPGMGGGIIGTTSQFGNVGGATVIDFLFPDLITTNIGQLYFFEVIVDAGQSITMYYSSSNPYASGIMFESSYAGGGGGGYGTFASNGADLYFVTASGVPGSLATYTASDPTTGMLASVMADYKSRAGNISVAAGDIVATGLSLTASFNTNTVYEVLDKVLDMAPAGFYYYVDIGDNGLRFKRVSKTPDYLLVKGRHIESLQLAMSIENVINEELFSGGATAGVNLYSKYTDATSKSLFGPRLERKSDNRVKVQGTADAIGGSRIKEFKDEQYYTTLSLLARTMNITDIKPGQTVGLRGFGSWIDGFVLQITKLDYTPERANLQVGTLPVFYNDSYEEIVRGLVAEQTVANPSTPS